MGLLTRAHSTMVNIQFSILYARGFSPVDRFPDGLRYPCRQIVLRKSDSCLPQMPLADRRLSSEVHVCSYPITTWHIPNRQNPASIVINIVRLLLLLLWLELEVVVLIWRLRFMSGVEFWSCNRVNPCTTTF